MLKPKPSPTFKAHLDAIQSREVTKTNVIGIRKLLNGAARREAGHSVGMTTPLGTMDQADKLVSELHRCHPRVVGELHASGIKVLQNRRYAKRWDGYQQDVIDNLSHFELVDYEWIGNLHTVPVYRAVSRPLGYGGVVRSFDFRNVPWQSGGDGPEVVA